MILRKWKKIGKPKILAQGYNKKIERQKFLNPKSKKIEDYYLIGQNDWSIVLPITNDGKVIYVRQYKQGCDEIVIELPAGMPDYKNEKPKEVMKRELMEETGYKAQKIISLGSFFMSTRNSSARFHAFLALGCKKVAMQELDANEEIEIGNASIKEWLKMITKGKIKEHSSIVTTFLSLPHIGGKITFKK